MEKIEKKRFFKANKKYIYMLLFFVLLIVICSFLYEDKIEYCTCVFTSLLSGIMASAIVLLIGRRNERKMNDILRKRQIISEKYEQYAKILESFYSVLNVSNNSNNAELVVRRLKYCINDLVVYGGMMDVFKSNECKNKYMNLRKSISLDYGKVNDDINSAKKFVKDNMNKLEEIQQILSEASFNYLDEKLVAEKDMFK